MPSVSSVRAAQEGAGQLAIFLRAESIAGPLLCKWIKALGRCASTARGPPLVRGHGYGSAAALRNYETLQLPQAWVGQSEPILAEASSDSTPTTVRGVPVSAGAAEGQARVVLDPFELNGFDDGDILVCRFTDPSWAPLLNLAGALVIDIGGPMSHGAIVARELGIPAVINTVTGTSAIRTGDRVRVDAAAGLVEILDRDELCAADPNCSRFGAQEPRPR